MLERCAPEIRRDTGRAVWRNECPTSNISVWPPSCTSLVSSTIPRPHAHTYRQLNPFPSTWLLPPPPPPPPPLPRMVPNANAAAHLLLLFRRYVFAPASDSATCPTRCRLCFVETRTDLIKRPKWSRLRELRISTRHSRRFKRLVPPCSGSGADGRSSQVVPRPVSFAGQGHTGATVQTAPRGSARASRRIRSEGMGDVPRHNLGPAPPSAPGTRQPEAAYA
jgi:hypothetical protein